MHRLVVKVVNRSFVDQYNCTDVNSVIRQKINQFTVTKKLEIIVYLSKKAVCLPRKQFSAYRSITWLLSTPMGVDYVVIGFDMEVQP